ncbi:hypothetical protein BBJ29_002093 [Phytophthora kernoviae]|uniref:AAA+ ATPase domain-containing protein n=1 Tax=Phytophthora kernoviae TaxID=325452 RepID=A0A3F2RR10_9STRA|nr:hypothetical protein BBP00_00004712 [Phytophthora kernoviae]RLN69865.1 hypothetical protein BBJ29_002093 [Phytophthora kernoviae]
MLVLMLVAAAFLCSGNLCIIASKTKGLVPYSSVTVTLLTEVLKLSAMLSAVIATRTAVPNQLELSKGCYYAVPALLNALESNLNYVILRYLDAATVSVLWNLKILLTAVLFRYVLKHPLSELHKLAIALLVLGVLTSQSNRFHQTGNGSTALAETETSSHVVLGLSLSLVSVTLSSCASVFAEWTLKRQADCPFLWQSVQMYSFGTLFNAIGLLVVDGKTVYLEGFFHGYSGWTVAIIVVNSIGGVSMACILKYLDNIACVYSHSMAMMLTTFFSMMFFAFSPSLEFACGLGVLVVSMYLYHHPLAQVASIKQPSPTSDTGSEDDDTLPAQVPSLQLKKTSIYMEVPSEVAEEHRLFVNGPPGSGKTTLAKLLSEEFNLEVIATGDLLRENMKAQTPSGRRAQRCIAAKTLVPDRVVVDMVEAKIISCTKRGRAGWVLDSFPRTTDQAKALMAKQDLIPKVVIVLELPKSDCISRIRGRRFDPVTGTIFHSPTNVPIDAVVRARLTRRRDDSSERLSPRFDAYQAFGEATNELFDSSNAPSGRFKGYTKPSEVNAPAPTVVDTPGVSIRSSSNSSIRSSGSTTNLEVAAASVDMEKFKNLLLKGFDTVKHGRRGRPHPRLIFTDLEFKRVFWQKAMGPADRVGKGKHARLEQSIALIDVIQVTRGMKTTVLKRSGNVARYENYVSLVTPTRTLDLEMPGAQLADFLQRGFDQLLHG